MDAHVIHDIFHDNIHSGKLHVLHAHKLDLVVTEYILPLVDWEWGWGSG